MAVIRPADSDRLQSSRQLVAQFRLCAIVSSDMGVNIVILRVRWCQIRVTGTHPRSARTRVVNGPDHIKFCSYYILYHIFFSNLNRSEY
jgi:hypothetical protein